VGVEVVLPVEERVLGDAAAERESQLDRPLDRPSVRHRQRARMAEADRARSRVLGVAVAERAAAEQLRPGLQVDVDLEPDDRFPVAHRSGAGTESNWRARSGAWGVRNSVFSENCGPISWSPTGSPSERPHGIDGPGRPAMLAGIVRRSERYMASG